MAWFNSYSFFKVTPFARVPQQSVYDTITVGGQMTIGNVWVKNVVLTDAEVNAIPLDEVPLWDSDTNLLATFQTETTGGGTVAGLVGAIENYDVFRREVGETTSVLLKTLDASATGFIDYTTEPNRQYDYEVQAYNSTERAEPFVSDTVSTNYFGFYIIDASDDADDSRTVYYLRSNATTDGITNIKDNTKIETNNKFPSFLTGNRDYLEGTIQAIAGVPNNTTFKIDQTIDFLEEFREFINNGKPKFVKTRQGRTMRCYTHEPNYPIWTNLIEEQLHFISIRFTEISNVDGTVT